MNQMNECAKMVKDFIACDECKTCSLGKRKIFINNTSVGVCVFLKMFMKIYLSEIEHEMAKTLKLREVKRK